MVNNNLSNGNELNNYLKSSNLCDFKNPRIQNLANQIKAGCKSNEETALKIFFYVRDTVKFNISNSKTPASKVLKSHAGECVTKTNFHIALLRAVGIPARFHRSKCKKDPLKGIVPSLLYSKMPPILSHFWVEVYLSGRWIACEGLLDKDLYSALLNLKYISKEVVPTIDWDGKNDLILLKTWIVEEFGVLSSYEEIYKILNENRKEEGMPPRIIENLFGWIIYAIFKKHTKKIRSIVQ